MFFLCLGHKIKTKRCTTSDNASNAMIAINFSKGKQALVQVVFKKDHNVAIVNEKPHRKKMGRISLIVKIVLANKMDAN